LNSDRGSGTVLALAAVAMAISVFGVSQIIAQNLLIQQRVQVVTETMALAAADALQGAKFWVSMPGCGPNWPNQLG
jgi:hypothetical protein